MEEKEAPAQNEDKVEEDPIDQSSEFAITVDSDTKSDVGKKAPAKKAPVCSPPDCVDIMPC